MSKIKEHLITQQEQEASRWNGLKRTPIRQVSKKQAKKNALWSKIKRDRILYLIDKYEYLLCEYCRKVIVAGYADAHHIDRDRSNNTPENCFIVHRVPCHDFITLNNLRVVQEGFENA